METWKSDLQDFMRQMKFFPYESWKKDLLCWCKEYTKDLEGLDGVYTKVILSQKYDALGRIELMIQLKHEKPFHIHLHYLPDSDTANPILEINYTKCFNTNKQYAAICKGQGIDKENEQLEFYDWAHDNIDLNKEPALNKAFVLEYITLQFKKYMLTREL